VWNVFLVVPVIDFVDEIPPVDKEMVP